MMLRKGLATMAIHWPVPDPAAGKRRDTRHRYVVTNHRGGCSRAGPSGAAVKAGRVRHAVVVANSEPEELTIFTLPELLQNEYRKYHGRMTDVVAFELPITVEGVDFLEADESACNAGRELPLSAVSEDLRAVVMNALPEEAHARFYDADSGRGASGYAVALEVAGYVADVFGAGTATWLGAQGVRRLYERIAGRLGRRPLISLGTAVFLAAADLSEKVGAVDFRLHGRGDARTGAPDASFSGEDHFFVIFERDRTLHSYLVDARGRVHYQGTLRMRNILDELPEDDA